jgi:hypothetical protein
MFATRDLSKSSRGGWIAGRGETGYGPSPIDSSSPARQTNCSVDGHHSRNFTYQAIQFIRSISLASLRLLLQSLEDVASPPRIQGIDHGRRDDTGSPVPLLLDFGARPKKIGRGPKLAIAGPDISRQQAIEQLLQGHGIAEWHYSEFQYG